VRNTKGAHEDFTQRRKDRKDAKVRSIHCEGLNLTRLMRRFSTRSTLNTPAASTIRSPGRN